VAGKPEVTCTVTSRHAAYNVTVRTTARTAHIDWYPAFDSGLSQRYIVWLVSEYYASTAAIINRYWADTYTCRVPILRAISFFAAQRIAKRGICYEKVCPSVCPFVRLSVTLVSHAYTVQDIEICFAPWHRTMCLVSCGQISQFRCFTPNECVEGKHSPRRQRNLTNNPPHLGNYVKYDVSHYFSLAGVTYGLSNGTCDLE